MDEIKALIEDQGKAFEAFKAAHDQELAELKKGAADVVTKDTLARIEKSLDGAIEAKAKIEATIEAERKEREALELRLGRSLAGASPDEAKKLAALDEFKRTVTAINAERGRPAPEVDGKLFDAFAAAQRKWLREGDKALGADEVKTMSVGSDPDGGYFVTPDVTGRIARKVYESSPMRQFASVVTIGTDRLEGIEDLDEAGAGYAGDKSTSGDTTTPQVGRWAIQVYALDTEPKATQQLLDDANVDVEGWLAGKVADKFARFEAAEFVAGATNRIRGITSYATADDDGSGVTWGTIGRVGTGQSGAFPSSTPADKLHDLVGLLKSAYLPGAAFMLRRSVITAIRKFKAASTNEYLWQPSLVAGQPETLLGYPVVRAEDMPAMSAGSPSVAFGNFAEAYQIVDRVGIRVMRDPYTSKPFVKFYTTRRTGGGVVNFEAIKFLRFA